MAYTKVFGDILTSTVWLEDSDTRVVWLTMLAMADQHGEVMGSVPGLAHLARVPVEVCEAALAKFMSPDKYSRTETAEGRRIEKIDGGWELINHAKYRLLASKEDSVEKNAERQRRFKRRKALPSVTERYRALPVTESGGTITQHWDIADTDKNRAAPPNGADPNDSPLHKPSPVAAREPPWGAATHDGEPVAPLIAAKRMPT